MPTTLPKARICDIYLCEDRKTIRSVTPGHSTAGAPESEPGIIGAVIPCRSQAVARSIIKLHAAAEQGAVEFCARNAEGHLVYFFRL